MKSCKNKDCKQKNPQSNDAFEKLKEGRGGLHPRCKGCRREYYKLNRDNNIERVRKYRLRKYWPHLSPAEAIVAFKRLLDIQGGVCAICSKPETLINPRTKTLKSLAVDHCHRTKTVRGLLCGRCNRAIGYLNDNPQYCIKAANYLTEST